MTARQHIEAIYFYGKRLLLRRAYLEAYFLEDRADMQGRKQRVPAIGGLDLPVDWRSLKRAHSETLWMWVAGLYLAETIVQAKILGTLHSGASLWVPFSWVPDVLHQPSPLSHIPFEHLLVMLFACLGVDAFIRAVVCYRACDRTGLSVEHGSAGFARPEDLASDNPADNLFPPGYDIYGGFHPEERRQRVLDLELLTEKNRTVATRILRESAAEIPLSLPVSGAPDAPPVGTSIIADILAGKLTP